MTTPRPAQAAEPDHAALYAANRRHWDALTRVHLAPDGTDLAPLRRADTSFGPIVEPELAEVAGDLRGQRLIHLQCHFGLDTLALAQRGAATLGVDFSPEAIAAARSLAAEHRLARRARFIECDLYDAPDIVGAAGGFDLAFTTWGTIGWLHDIRAWARVVAHFLKPGGRLYLADAHPAALVLDDAAPGAGGMPGWSAPYFASAPLTSDSDVAGRFHTWMHPLGDVVTALIEAGLAIRFLREHDGVPWRMFRCQTEDADGLFRWPATPWLPLAFSLAAQRPVVPAPLPPPDPDLPAKPQPWPFRRKPPP